MKKYLAWIPALVIMTAIFWFSAQPADVSTEMSDSVTRALLWTAEAVGLTDRLSPEQVHDLCGLLATPVRKAAHITEFAVLHLTVLFALFQWELPWKKWLKAALAVTVAYACTDELHQLFVPGRAGMVTDVLIDSMGAALITGLLWIVGRRREGTPGEDGTVWAAGRPEDRSRQFPGPDSRVQQMVQGAAIAAVYVVLTMAFRPISFGPVQFRISEARCVLPYFTPAAVPGVFLGCLISNLLGGAAALDVVFGSLATLMGAVGSRLFRKNRYLVSLPPIAANTLIIPWVLKYAYGSGDMVWFMMITVGAGEILAVGILGQLLLGALEPYREELF